MKKINNKSPIFLVISSLIFGFNLPAKAETCVPISVVNGQGNSITKTVSPPTIPAGPLGMVGVDITRNNWNTDWAVPSEQKFKRFIATISSDGGAFDIKMYLKYSDQTTGEFYNSDGVQINSNQPLQIEAAPRPDDEPYQVNLLVGGLNHIGSNYTASVVACY
ncbi:hypothetical protein [Gloeothece verrucosa]|uniref:Uncharacterized protein n=1 Tax=Gloeothece verrucosa (strain PCC 7822) TaxID=497965 RepID=E0ULE9_GLOV7|nr:hypothetical protein [Gloeothece verrucosa]ADN17779.1 conserved hypothetical protein [Gloeothece verrucosa PCC 7822]